MSRNGIVMSVIQEKGGQGKSNTTLNLSYYLARNQYKTLIIDLDGQAADITYYLFGNHVGDSTDPMRGNIHTIVDLLSGQATMESTILPVATSLDCIPANINVTNLSSATQKISTFRKVINQLKEAYDFILIDVPPTPNWSHVLCLSVCNYILPLVNLDPASPKAFLSLNESVEEVRDTTNAGIQYLGVVVNKYDIRTNLAKSIMPELERIASTLETSMFHTRIHQSVVITEQTLLHKGIFDYAPKSKAAQEYSALGTEILQRLKKKGAL